MVVNIDSCAFQKIYISDFEAAYKAGNLLAKFLSSMTTVEENVCRYQDIDETKIRYHVRTGVLFSL